MSFLFDSRIICVNCNQRQKPEDIYVSVKSIGICHHCYKKLKKIPNFNPGPGLGKLQYVISPFYYNYEMKNIIHRYKFSGEWKLCELFSKMLYDYLKIEKVISDFDIITAVPLSRQRFNLRGYNQSELVAKLLSKKLSIEYKTCIFRRKNTKSQRLLKGRERLSNVKDAFIANREIVEGKTILIFDDIFTTGTTMASCAEELINKGAKSVCGLAIAVSGKR